MSLTLGLNITYGSYSEMTTLNHSLKTNEQFIHTINQFITKHISKQPEEEHIEEFEVLETEIVDAENCSTVLSNNALVFKNFGRQF